MTKTVFVSSLLLLLFLLCAPLFAHKVNLYAYAEGDRIYVRAYFRGGTPAKESLVEAFAPGGERIVALRTDENGECNFTVSFRADILIKLSAGEGHLSEFLLKADELPQSLPPYEGAATQSESLADKEPQPKENKRAEEKPSLEMQAIERVVESAVERKIAPLKKMLLELKAKESTLFEKTIAGVGIILAFFGIYLFVKVRYGKGEKKER